MKLEPICFEIPFEVFYRFDEKLGYDNVSVPLIHVSVDDLDYLAMNFRTMLFQAAGKSDPMNIGIRSINDLPLANPIPQPKRKVEKTPYDPLTDEGKKWVGKRDPNQRVTFEPYSAQVFRACDCGRCNECIARNRS